MSLELDKKYNINVPRYTSYPTVPYWSGAPSYNTWLTSIKDAKNVDLYIHIPFCQSLCYYCGCFKKITKNKSRASHYIDLLLREWQIYIKSNPGLKIKTIHFGGGTPTFLSSEDFEFLLGGLRPYLANDFIGSVELDPRTTSKEQLITLRKYNFLRASLGVQDFDYEVQKTINRIQPEDVVSSVIDTLKELGFTSINFDLIYGLPKQSKQTIENTIQKVIKYKPDMIAFYSYAHLPNRIPSQKIFKDEDMAKGTEKKALYDFGNKLLLANGYSEIGLDHFAKKDSYLNKAYESGKLLRSFMGYTDKKSSLMVGLGVSSISQSEKYFIQNTKDLTEYESTIKSNELSIVNGHQLSESDQQREKIIQNWMCTGRVSLKSINELAGNEDILDEISNFKADNLVEIGETHIEITDLGRPYLRVIGSSFDEYLKLKKKGVQFSSSL